jgi:glycosyltransferase involved in cell wall biosynthesis
MRVAINTGFLLSGYSETSEHFIQEVLKYLTNKFPAHEFIFMSDKVVNTSFAFSANVTSIAIGSSPKHPFFLKYWYDIKLPRILKKYRADVFVSFNGLCSLTARIPQCVVIIDPVILYFSSVVRKSYSFFYKRYVPKFLQKAKQIASISEFSKQEMINRYKIEKEKISVVYGAPRGIFKPVQADIAEFIKEKYTAGTEYFLCTDSAQPEKNLVSLLKAFSIFKKRQKSNIKLVLAGGSVRKRSSFIEHLKNYKYREHVVILGDLTDDEVAEIMASAYAFIYPAELEAGFPLSILEAMECHIPVITSLHSPMTEIAKDAALYADTKNVEDLADKIMLIYKDENLRKEVIEKGKIIASQYSWEKTAELLWQTILKAVY